MKSPYGSLTAERRKRYFWISFIVTLVLMISLNLAGAPMTSAEAPYGIVSYELAGSIARAQAILTSWDQGARLAAAFNLGLDYLFMPAYAFTISLACLWAGDVLRQRNWPLVFAGIPLAWGQWLAAGLDAIENLALTVILFNAPASPWPQLAAWCATIKFVLIFLGLVYALLAVCVTWLMRPAQR